MMSLAIGWSTVADVADRVADFVCDAQVPAALVALRGASRQGLRSVRRWALSDFLSSSSAGGRTSQVVRPASSVVDDLLQFSGPALGCRGSVQHRHRAQILAVVLLGPIDAPSTESQRRSAC